MLDALDPMPPAMMKDKLSDELLMRVESTPIQQIFGGSIMNESRSWIGFYFSLFVIYHRLSLSVTCEECKHRHINVERILEMNFGLPKEMNRSDVRRIEVNRLMQNFFREETIQAFKCDRYVWIDRLSIPLLPITSIIRFRCKKVTDATRQTTLLRSPEVLIIHLKRFTWQRGYGGKNQTSVIPDVSCLLDTLFLSI